MGSFNFLWRNSYIFRFFFLQTSQILAKMQNCILIYFILCRFFKILDEHFFFWLFLNCPSLLSIKWKIVRLENTIVDHCTLSCHERLLGTIIFMGQRILGVDNILRRPYWIVQNIELLRFNFRKSLRHIWALLEFSRLRTAHLGGETFSEFGHMAHFRRPSLRKVAISPYFLIVVN